MLKKRIFLTGITGLLGTNLTNKLLSQDYEITAIVRDPKRYHGKRSKNLNLIERGLFDDYDSLLKNTDIVIHIAALTATSRIHYKNYHQVNYEATVRLFDKAHKYKISKFIYISTANTIGYGDLKNPGTEGNPIQTPFTKSFYAQTKLKAERYLIENNQTLDLRILNPTFMIGPNDSKPSSGKIILHSLHKFVVFYPPGGKSFVPVKDVVQAIIKSFSHGKNNECYLIAGENLTYFEFYKQLKSIVHQTQILIKIPQFFLMILGFLGSIIRFLGFKTSLSLSNMKSLCIRNYYSNEKSIRELNMSYHSLQSSLKEAVNYFNEK